MSAITKPTAGSAQATIRIGSYDLLGTIGQGNFSVCKLAQNKITNQMVAIKCVEKRNLDATHLTRLYREIEIMKQMDHTNIIKLNQVMESKSMIYLVCEYAVNGEIFDYISKKGPMSEKMACEKFCQIISAVEYCHTKNIVHRDLKSENLLLDAKMNIKLADFGFANYFDLINPLKTFCGSPPYAAPEIFCGKKYYGPEIDCWSLGVILYVLVSGCLPFDSENLQYLKQRVLNCKYRVPYFMSQDCESLIGHMLVVNPSKRYKLQQIKLHKWIKANSSSFYYLFSNNANPSATQPNQASINSSSSSQNTKNMSIYYRIKKKSSSFKQKSIKAKNLNWSEQKLEKNSTGETATPKPNSKLNTNANTTSKTNNKIVINCDCVDDSVVDEPETKNKNLNLLTPKTNEKENAALSCISLPLYSFEEYNYNKDSNKIANAESSFNINSSAPVIDQTSLAQVKTNKISATKSTENIYKEVVGEKEETKKTEDQITSRLNTCSLSDRNTQELVIKKAEIKPAPNESATLAASLASNLRYSALSKPVSNSSSLDEGVESDLSSPTSSFSTDFLSSSVNSCYSMQISSFESQLSQNSFKLASNNINMTNMLFDQSASKKSKKFFMLKKSLIKQSKLKNNFSNLTQLNRELNSLIKSSKSSINSEENKSVQLNANLAKKENVQVCSDDLKSRLIKENTDKFDRAIGDAGSERTSSNQKIRQSNFIRSFKKKASNNHDDGNENNEPSQIASQKASCLAKLKRNFFRQKSVSLNSLKDDYLNGLSLSKGNQNKIGTIIDESSAKAKFGSGAIN